MAATAAATASGIDAVLRMAARGWRLFPVEARGKKPLIRAWQKEATTDNAAVRRLSRQSPGCNWGLACGVVSDVWILDVDGDEGSTAVRELCREHGEDWLHTLTARTARGQHLYFSYPLEATIRNSAGKIAHGLDVRGDGGYVIVPPSVHPSGATYEWIDPAAAIEPAPEWLLHMVTGPTKQPTLPAADSSAIPEGQRNAELASLAGTMRKRGMTPEEIEAALKAVNLNRCRPPLPEAEVRAIAASVSRYAPAKATEQIAILEGRRAPAPPSAQWPEPLAEEALHGLAGEIVQAIEPHSEADPAALLLQLHVGFGSVIGSSPYYRVEATKHRANLNAAVIGATSHGRKGTAWGHIRMLLEVVDELWAETRILGGLSSGEGLIAAVRDPRADDAGVTDKRLLVIEPELASVLRVMARDGNTLSAMVRQSWDSGDLRIMTKHDPHLATGAHVSIVAHCTKDELLRYLDRTELANGFANRFLWVCARRSKLLPDGGRVPSDVLVKLGRKLSAAVGYARHVSEMHRDAGATAIWREIYGPLSEGSTGMFGAVTSRAEAQVLRLSMIYALLDCSEVITADHLNAGLAVWQYCSDSARFIFGDSLGEPVADQLLSALRESADGLSRTSMSQALGRNRSSAEIDRALYALAAAGLARTEKRSTDGRSVELWFAMGTDKGEK